MNYLRILTAVIFLVSFSFTFLNKTKTSIRVGNILGFFFFCVILLPVEYNADWDIYQILFDNPQISFDITFSFLAKFFKTYNLSYRYLYITHVLLISLLFSLYSYSIKVTNGFFILLTYIILMYISLTNQIRYYLAFPLFLISTYYLIIAKDKIKFFITLLLAISSHIVIVLMIPFYFLFFKVKIKYFSKLVFAISIFSLLVAFSFENVINLSFRENLNSYLTEDRRSSFLGGLFNLIPIIFYYIVINIRHKKLIKNYPEITNDLNYVYLYKLSVYPFIFLLLSIYLQIFANRFIQPMIIVWLFYFFYTTEYTQKNKLNNSFLIFLFIIVNFAWSLLLSPLILGSDFTGFETFCKYHSLFRYIQ